MTQEVFRTLVEEVNRRLQDRPVGQLQEMRRRVLGKQRLPSRKVFSIARVSTFKNYAFHVGGRTELQFNLGLEPRGEQDYLRHGVAFSFQKSQSLYDIDQLGPWVEGFNSFFDKDEARYANLRLWQWSGDEPSEDFPAGKIPNDWIQEGWFVFLGTRQPVRDTWPNLDRICDDLDDLFALYRYVLLTVEQVSESTVSDLPTPGFRFKSGIGERKTGTTQARSSMLSDIDLRHNKIQEMLCDRLVTEHGANNVGAENISPSGGRIDVVVRHEGGYSFYEIKTGWSPRECLRAALGQLLEYAFWKPSLDAAVTDLIVVGEANLDEDGERYLALLQERFGLPIKYEAVCLE